MKRTSSRGVKQTLKPCAYKRSEHAVAGEVKRGHARSRSESESEQGERRVGGGRRETE